MSALALTDSELRIASAPPAEQRARHRSFQEKLARAAEALAESKRPAPKPVAINPEAMPAETDPPLAASEDPQPLEPLYPTIDKIQRETAALFSVTVLDLKSERRTADIILPRQICMWLCRNLTLSSLPKISRQFGGRDHSTVLNAVNRINYRLPREFDVALAVAILSERITGVQQ